MMTQNISDKSNKTKSSSNSFAIASLVIGILTIIIKLSKLEELSPNDLPALPGGAHWASLDSFYIFLMCVSFVGLICGIIGLWSNKKIMAIAGTILCSLAFVLYIV